jgi:TPP-dependent trihydroxycyclohexane-1,2-dione (THcHDO) dehydratase
MLSNSELIVIKRKKVFSIKEQLSEKLYDFEKKMYMNTFSKENEGYILFSKELIEDYKEELAALKLELSHCRAELAWYLTQEEKSQRRENIKKEEFEERNKVEALPLNKNFHE